MIFQLEIGKYGLMSQIKQHVVLSFLSVNQYGLLAVLHLPYSPDVTPSNFHFFCLPNRSSPWKSFQVTSGVKGGGA